MLNLMNFWLRYLRLKTIDTTSKFNFDSTFIASSDIELPLIFEFDEELTEIFKVKGKTQFPEQQ